MLASFPVSTPSFLSHVVKNAIKSWEWRLGTRLVLCPVGKTNFLMGNETSFHVKRGMGIRKVLWCRSYLVWLLFGDFKIVHSYVVLASFPGPGNEANVV